MAVDQGASQFRVDVWLFGQSADWAFGKTRKGLGLLAERQSARASEIRITGSYRRGHWENKDKSVELRHQLSVLRPEI